MDVSGNHEESQNILYIFLCAVSCGSLSKRSLLLGSPLSVFLIGPFGFKLYHLSISTANFGLHDELSPRIVINNLFEQR